MNWWRRKMGMFYVFYLASDNIGDFSQIKQLVKDITPTLTPEIAKGRPQISEDTDDLLRIWCEYFSICVKKGGQHVIYRSEDYGMNFEYQFWFDVYTVTPNWLEEMLSFVGKIMKVYNGDCVLEANGDTAIVMRKDNIVVVDDKKLKGTQRFPFGGLGLEYQAGDLVQV
jgi:hypothetical protein